MDKLEAAICVAAMKATTAGYRIELGKETAGTWVVYAHYGDWYTRMETRQQVNEWLEMQEQEE